MEKRVEIATEIAVIRIAVKIQIATWLGDEIASDLGIQALDEGQIAHLLFVCIRFALRLSLWGGGGGGGGGLVFFPAFLSYTEIEPLRFKRTSETRPVSQTNCPFSLKKTKKTGDPRDAGL